MIRDKINIETMNFIQIDQTRLMKINELMTKKIFQILKYKQYDAIIQEQKQQINELREEIFLVSNENNNGFRKSMNEIFNSFYSIS